MSVRISVCMATYNGERYLEEQLRSILDELGSEDEVIVSDDGSTDSTLRILSGIGDSRVRVLQHRQEPQRFAIDYAASNFENAMRAARGEYIFLSDQDDIWHKGKVERVLAELRDCDMVLHDCNLTDSRGSEIASSYFALRHPRFNRVSIFLKPSHLGCCMAFRRSVLEASLPIPMPGVGHDQWIALVTSSKRFRSRILPEVLMSYRKHESNVTPLKSRNPLWVKLRYRYYVAKAILKHLLLNQWLR